MNGFTTFLRAVAPALVAALLIVLIVASPSLAASATTEESTPVCFAVSAFLRNIAGDRSKIIQLSIVFVMVSVALLFKK